MTVQYVLVWSCASMVYLRSQGSSAVQACRAPPASSAEAACVSLSHTLAECTFSYHSVPLHPLSSCRKQFKQQPALLRNLPKPIVCIGDLHGDLQTLVRILNTHGMPPKTNYLFLGDLVDRCATPRLTVARSLACLVLFVCGEALRVFVRFGDGDKNVGSALNVEHAPEGVDAAH